MKKFLMLMLTLTIAITLAACGNNSNDESQNDKQTDEEAAEQAKQEVEVTDEEKVGKDEVVATVNDDEIKGSKYNLFYGQLKMQMQQFGQDIEDQDKIKENTLDELVAQELMLQDADDKDIKVSDEEIEKEFDKFKGDDEESFQAYLDEFDTSEETYKNLLSVSLVRDKYMDEVLNVDKITEQETKEAYENLKQQNEEITDYDEIKDDLKAQLKEQKQLEQLQAKLDKLKDSADIKTKI